MKINPHKIKEYLSKNNNLSNICPLCKQNTLTVTDDVFQLTEYNKNELKSTNLIFPVVPIVCKNCGNTHFINVFIADLINNKG